MKSLYGGGAVSAIALIAASFFTYARPSVAETKPQQQPSSQLQKTEQTQDPKSAAATSVQPGLLANAEAPTTGAAMTGKAVANAEAAPAEDVAVGTPVRPVQSYVATAYSLRGRTASGRLVAKGLIAADPSVLPLGSRVRLDAGSYSGEYLVADTGGAVRGRHIDIWIPTSREAMRFGRRSVKLTVLSLGASRKVRRRTGRQ
jgi:3D (Asp-Asp-Asp) domain-containing protein